jgi:3-hydroxyisobutyrate dehydrogenase-like beta-hydroxyacid dehydrogenase
MKAPYCKDYRKGNVAHTASRVGFVGLGAVALAMAKRIVSGGFETTVCADSRRQPVEEMIKLGAQEVKSPKEVAEASDAMIVMVPDDEEAREVIYGSTGLLQGVKRGHGILLMGTFSPAFCRQVGEAARNHRVDVLDAPVMGTRMRAKAGTLDISVGGDKDALEKYRHILERLGQITYCGALGMGQVVKLVNNIAANLNARVAYEAIAWGMRNGASEDNLVNHMKMGPANSFIVQNWELVKKLHKDRPQTIWVAGSRDLSQALAIAHELRQPCPLTAVGYELNNIGPPRLPNKAKG